jgi:hypothetical protein
MPSKKRVAESSSKDPSSSSILTPSTKRQKSVIFLKQFQSRTDCSRINFSNEVTVLVGADEVKCVAHRDVLCAKSGFFRDALSGSWNEGKKKCISLPEQCPTAFNIYLNYRYQGMIDLESDGDPVRKHNGQTRRATTPIYERLINSYILGDMLRDNGFCNALIDAWFEVRYNMDGRVMSSTQVNTVFENLPETSKLRKLVAHDLAYSAAPKIFQHCLDDYHPEVWKAVARVSVRESVHEIGRELKSPQARPRCSYHIHEEEDAPSK